MKNAGTNGGHTGTDAGRALFILWSLMAVPVSCSKVLPEPGLTAMVSDS